MSLADRPYMRQRATKRAQLRRAKRRGRWLLRFALVLDTPPIIWMVILLLLWLAATLVRSYLENYSSVYCYVWTDYCLP
ncbi:MAG: hypothetical protein OXP66_00515 [Candidatus Tectomicrobia bacterium]|nr:hypothetical protein [Candidatus Tectomicrobia bacterium]